MDGDPDNSSINISSAQFALSNFSNPVDGNSFKSLNEILINFKKKHDAWLEAECLFHTNEEIQVFYGLIIMNDLIRHRWNCLTNDQRDCISTFIMGKTIKLATSSTSSSSAEETLLQKFNQSLIELFFIKYDRNEWCNFISDIIQSSYTNEQLCQNNFLLLKLLYQLIYQDNVIISMHHSKLVKLKRLLATNYFDKIFKLLLSILEMSKNICLVQRSLELLDLFMELKFDIIGSQEADKIFGYLSNLLLVSVVRKECIKTIANFMNYSKNCSKLVSYYKKILQQLIKVIPSSLVVKEQFQNLEQRDQTFLWVLTDILAEHTPLLYPEEASRSHDPRLEDAWLFLLRLTAIEPPDLHDSSSIRTIAVQYWSQLSSILHSQTSGTAKGACENAFSTKAMVYLKEVSELVMVNCSSSQLDGLIVCEDKLPGGHKLDINDSLLFAMQNMFRNYFLLNSKSTAEHIQSKFSDLLTSPNVPIKQLYSLCRSIEFVLLSDQVRRQLTQPTVSYKNPNEDGKSTSETSSSFNLQSILLELLRFSINSLLTLQNQMLTFRDQIPICCGIIHLLGCFCTLGHLHPFLTRVVIKRLCVYLGVHNEIVKKMALGSLRKWAVYSPFVFTELPPTLLSVSSPKSHEPVDIFNRLITEINNKNTLLSPPQIVNIYETLAIVIVSINSDHTYGDNDNKNDNDDDIDTFCKQNHFIDILYRYVNQGWSALIEEIQYEIWKLLDPSTINFLQLNVSTNARICRTFKSLYLIQLLEILPEFLDLFKLVSSSLGRIHRKLTRKNAMFSMQSPGDHLKSIQGIAQLIRLRETMLEFIRVFITEINWSNQTYLELTSVLVPLLISDQACSRKYNDNNSFVNSHASDIDRDICLQTIRVVIDKSEVDTVTVSSILKSVINENSLANTITADTTTTNNIVDADNCIHHQSLLLILSIMKRYSGELLNDANLLPFSRLIKLIDFVLWSLKTNLLELKEISFQVLEIILQYYESSSSNSHQRKKFIRQFYIHILHNVLVSAIESGKVYEESGLIQIITTLISWISADNPLCHFRWSRHHHGYQKRPNNTQLMEGNSDYVVKTTSQLLSSLQYQCNNNIQTEVHTEFIRNLIKTCCISSVRSHNNAGKIHSTDDDGQMSSVTNESRGNINDETNEGSVLILFRDYLLYVSQQYMSDDDEEKDNEEDIRLRDLNDNGGNERSMVIG